MKKLINSLPCWGRWHGKAVTDEGSSSNEKTNTDLIHRKRSPFRDREGSRSRRGFTLVEVVVALVIIVLVSGISIGVVTVNNKAHAETIDMIEATNIAENAIECFRFAVRNGGEDVKGTFEKHLAKSMGVELEFDDDGKIINYPFVTPENPDSYTITEGRVVVEMKINGNSITITATNGGTNALIETKTYTVR